MLSFFGRGNLRATPKTVLFRDDRVTLVLKSSCIRPYTPVFRARLPCPHKKFLVFRGALRLLIKETQNLKHLPRGEVATFHDLQKIHGHGGSMLSQLRNEPHTDTNPDQSSPNRR